jgi:membrane protein
LIALFQIAMNVWLRIGRDNLTLVAAGVAFYAMTAIFLAIAAFVPIYGLFAEPSAVQEQIAGFSSLLPKNSLKLLADALQNLASKGRDAALAIGLGDLFLLCFEVRFA